MAAAFVRQATGGSSTAQTTGTAITITAPASGNVLVACIALGSSTGGARVSSVASTGATWTLVAQSQQNATGTNRQEIWVGTGDTGTSVTITFSASSKWAANISEFSGLSGAVAYSTLASEGFDGVAAGTWPATWSADTPLTTGDAGTALPTSTPNAAVLPVAHGNNNLYFASYATPDSAGGQVRVSATVGHLNSGAGAGEQDAILYARGSSALLNANSGTASYYRVDLVRAVSAGLYLQKVVAGAGSTFSGPIGGAAFADGVPYRLRLLVLGSTLQAQCQRLSDGFWLGSGGTFAADAGGTTAWATATDSSITGSGYAGLGFYMANSSGGDVGADDFVLEQAAASTTGSVTNATNTTTAGPIQCSGYGDLAIAAMNLAQGNSGANFSSTSGSPDARTALTWIGSGATTANNVSMQALYDVASGGVNEQFSWVTTAAWQYAYAMVVLKAADPVPLGYSRILQPGQNAVYRM